jgi:hypothetical protein
MHKTPGAWNLFHETQHNPDTNGTARLARKD